MTPDQEKQFNLYGCVSRSIIKATKIRNIPISKVDFVDRYSHLFPKDKCGLLAIDGFCEVVKDLGLAKRVNSTRNIFDIIHNIKCGQKSHIFALTELQSNLLDQTFHCRLVLRYVNNQSNNPPGIVGLHLFSPVADGTDIEQLISLDHLEKMVVHFLVLIP